MSFALKRLFLGDAPKQSRFIDGGLLLEWHLDRLRECGFCHVDCFWRHDCDAIYGGLKKT